MKRTQVGSVLDAILNIAPSVRPGKGAQRDGKWPATQRRFIKKNPVCAVCGGREALNVHHVIPFEYGGPELDESNLITLCRGTFNCHLLFGHLGCYNGGWNPLVRADAEMWRFRLRARSVLVRMAKKELKQQAEGKLP